VVASAGGQAGGTERVTARNQRAAAPIALALGAVLVGGCEGRADRPPASDVDRHVPLETVVGTWAVVG